MYILIKTERVREICLIKYGKTIIDDTKYNFGRGFVNT